MGLADGQVIMGRSLVLRELEIKVCQAKTDDVLGDSNTGKVCGWVGDTTCLRDEMQVEDRHADLRQLLIITFYFYPLQGAPIFG